MKFYSIPARILFLLIQQVPRLMRLTTNVSIVKKEIKQIKDFMTTYFFIIFADVF